MNADGSDLKQLTTSGSARAPYCTFDGKEAYYSLHDSADALVVSLWSVPLAGGAPRKIDESRGFGSFLFDREQKHAELTTVTGRDEFMEILDLPSHKLVGRFPSDVSHAEGGSPSFSADGKALVGGTRTQTGNTLFYQPIDGSPSRSLIDATHDSIVDFAWSPSGNKLGVLQLRKSSDVVLITEQKNR
jgi:Tol biopolymer transport system component